MPSHSSHLLQPLDVGCFAPLKKAYGQQIENLVRLSVNHVTKLEFLPAFETAFNAALTTQNIAGGFRGAGLVPFDPEAVISKLDVRLRTPTPPVAEVVPWESRTPHNPVELACQTELVKKQITRHLDSSPTPIKDALDQLSKGAQTMIHTGVLLEAQVANLRKANEVVTERRRRLKRRIQHQGPLTIQEGLELTAQTAVNQQVPQKTCQCGAPSDRYTKQRRCRQCGETGHNSRTCQKDQETSKGLDVE